MNRILSALLSLLTLACVSASPEAQRVRVTSNPDVVRQCEFLGNVRAMSGWGSGGMGRNNVEETLKERTHALGGNVVFIGSEASGREAIGSGTGEAYKCASQK